jgi:hypothetical protein
MIELKANCQTNIDVDLEKEIKLKEKLNQAIEKTNEIIRLLK